MRYYYLKRRLALRKGTFASFIIKTQSFSFYTGDEPGPSGNIEGHGLRSSGRSGDPGGRGDADDYYYEVWK